MHCFFRVHLFKSLKDCVDDHFSFLSFKFILCFYLIIELTTFQKLNYYVERILGLENLMELHTVLVVQSPHYFNLFNEAFFPLILTVSSFFGKSFDGETFPNFKFFSEINWSKVSFSDFLFGFELFMESSLVEFSLKNTSTGLKIRLTFERILNSLFLFLKSQGGRS